MLEFDLIQCSLNSSLTLLQNSKKCIIFSMTKICERFRSDTSKGSGGKGNKRKSETPNKDIEQTKKQKPFNSSNDYSFSHFFSRSLT